MLTRMTSIVGARLRSSAPWAAFWLFAVGVSSGPRAADGGRPPKQPRGVRYAQPPVGAGAGLRIEMSGCSIELDGDSTLHKYSAVSHTCHATFGVDEGRQRPADVEAVIRGAGVRTFSLTIPVDTLKSGDASLDRHMWKALKSGQHPEIRFDMDSYRVPTADSPALSSTVDLHGRLRVAGVERSIQLAAAGTPAPGGLRVSGEKDLLMTDYDITPPKLSFGMIKAANRVTIKFDALLVLVEP